MRRRPPVGGEEVASLDLLAEAREQVRWPSRAETTATATDHLMNLITASTMITAQANPFSVVAKTHGDGSVLLSTANDCICKLNGVGALTWLVLEQNRAPLSVDQVVDELRAQFESINADGDALYDVSTEQLKEDTARFIEALADIGLLQVQNASGEQPCYQIKEGISATTSTTLANVGNTAPATDVSPSVAPAAAAPDTSETQPGTWETLTAFLGLFAFDLLLRLRGFEALIKKVESWPIAESRTTDPEICRRVGTMVNRAQMYYPKKAMCLQHSAVVTCLLRRKGVAAQMVLAAQEFPPKAHAWTEVAGRVVNDFQQVKSRYRELRRI